MITITKNTSTMPWTIANGGSAGGTLAPARQRGHFQERLDHQHEHIEIERHQRGQR